jgi:hypothetical protein
MDVESGTVQAPDGAPDTDKTLESNLPLFEPQRGLTDLADRINAEHDAYLAAAADAVGHAVCAGKLLADAKQGVRHGEWSSWVAAHCRFSLRMAQNYMRVAENEARFASRSRPCSLRQALEVVGLEKPGGAKKPKRRAPAAESAGAAVAPDPAVISLEPVTQPEQGNAEREPEVQHDATVRASPEDRWETIRLAFQRAYEASAEDEKAILVRKTLDFLIDLARKNHPHFDVTMLSSDPDPPASPTAHSEASVSSSPSASAPRGPHLRPDPPAAARPAGGLFSLWGASDRRPRPAGTRDTP